MEELRNSLRRTVGRADPIQVLLESSTVLLTGAAQDAVLSGILDIAGKVLAADAYAVWRSVDARGTWRAIAARGLSSAYRLEISASPSNIPTVIQAVEDTLREDSLAAFREAYEAEGIRSMLVVPLSIDHGQSATITLYWKRPRSFSQVDLDYAAALANFSAAALRHTELYERNQRERRRLTFLADASAVLSSSLEYEATLNRVAQLAVPHIADWCVVHVLENGVPNRIVVAHADPAMLARAEDYSRRFPEELREDRGLGAVLRTGVTEVYPVITDEMIVAAARNAEHLEILRSLGMTSSILVPLNSRGKMLGAIRLLAAGNERYFTSDDVQLAEDLARRAATAIENAQLHRAVLKQQSELRLSHSSARMGSWSWDLLKREIHWSDEFKRLHDLPQDAAPGFQEGSSLVHPDDRERVLAELEAVLSSDAEQLQFEHRVITAAGRTIWVQSRGMIHRDGERKATGIVGISMDVTESRLAEEALRRTEKLAAAGRLAATVAHEVNNPLEALTNLIFLASRTDGLPPEAKAYLATADGELSRMAHVVRQTLGFYRESVGPRPVDLGTVVAETIDLYRSRADSRAVCLTHTADAHTRVLANAGEIKQVIANLVSNAIDATAGGVVDTRVTDRGKNIEIAVSDNGTGISEGILARIFEPFFTTKAEVGTGLGLWVSKGIVEKHNGSMRVESSTVPEQSGTTFFVCLPALESNALQA